MQQTYTVDTSSFSQLSPYTPEWEDAIDLQFMTEVTNAVRESCLLPMPIPLQRIPQIIAQVAKWFWQNDDLSVERRLYLIKYEEFCKGNVFNKIIQLPPQIMAVDGCYKANYMKYGNMGDFSPERLMLSTYAAYGGVGLGAGMGAGALNYNLKDYVVTMYELDTFQQTLRPTLSYDFNMFSKKLIVYGDMGRSDVVIATWKRIRLQDLYQNYYFFRWCVCEVMKSLTKIFGTFTFKYPGGVEINFSDFKSDAQEEIDQIKEEVLQNRANDIIFQPNVL